jgi:hypothetical protein
MVFTRTNNNNEKKDFSYRVMFLAHLEFRALASTNPPPPDPGSSHRSTEKSLENKHLAGAV